MRSSYKYLLCALFIVLTLIQNFSAHASLGNEEEDVSPPSMEQSRRTYIDDAPRSSKKGPVQMSEQTHLLETTSAHEDRIEVIQEASSQKKVITQSSLVNTLQKSIQGRISGQTSAALIYSKEQLTFLKLESFEELAEYDYRKNLPFITLNKIDNTLFDDTKDPRLLLTCCHPLFLKFLTHLGGFAGMASLGLIAPGFTNGLLGEIFNYPPYGDASVGIMVTSALLMADVAYLQSYGLTHWVFMKSRSNFPIAKTSNDIFDADSNNEGVFILPDSSFSKWMKYAFLPVLSTGYAGQVVGLWLDVETGFWNFAIPLSFPMLIFYAKPYYQMAYDLWEEWDLKRRFIRSHESQEQRRALLQSLKEVKLALLEDDRFILTKYMWKPISQRTNFFGAESKPSQYTSDKIISALSCLLCRPSFIYEEVELRHDNKTKSRLGIEEETPTDKLFSGTSIVVMALNLYPNFMMVSETIETLLSSPVAGYVAGSVLSILLLIEAKNFQKWLHKTFSPNCCDPQDPFLRFFLRRKNNLFTLLNTAIFLADYYFAMSGESLKTLYFFMPFVALRYFAFFDMLSEDSDDQSLSSLARRNKIDPTPPQKKKQLLEFIKRAEVLIRYKFTDPVIDRINKAIYKTD